MGPDIIAAADPGAIIVTAATSIKPGNNKTAIVQAGNLRLILVPGKLIGIDPELANRLAAIRLEDARPDINGATGDVVVLMVRAAIVAPRNGKSAVLKAGHFWCILVSRYHRLINQELTACRAAVFIVLLGPNVIQVAALSTAAVVVLPGNNKAAVAQRCYRRSVLLAVGLGIDHELRSNRGTGLVEALAANIGTRPAAMAAAVFPRNHKPTVRKAGHRGIVLGT